MVSRICTAAVAWMCLLGLAQAQINVPPTIEPYRPIVATLDDPIPEGAQVQGGWITPTAEHLAVATGEIHIWAKPGTHTVTFRGVWAKTRPITIDGQTVQVLEGFGLIDRSATFEVKGGPNPPNPPEPPTPGGLSQILMLYDADSLDNLPQAQRQLLTSLKVRQQLVSAGHVVLEVLDQSSLETNTPTQYRAFFDAARGKPMPRVVLAPKGGGKVVDHPLPDSYEQLVKLLGGQP